MNKSPWIDTHVHVSNFGPDGNAREHLAEDLIAWLDSCDADLRITISTDGAEMSRMTDEPEAIEAGESDDP